MAPVLTRTLHVTRRFRAVPERVFAAWLDPDVARRWLFATASRPIAHVDVDARPGGSFRFVDHRPDATVEYGGEYLMVDSPWRLTFALSLPRPSPAITHVIVEIDRTPNGCTLDLVHEHVPKDRARDIEGRWCGMLYGLAELLESIPTAARERRTRRPLPFSPTPAYRSAP
jgi:uncharacterized protein YndB with AHSA1/START domain